MKAVIMAGGKGTRLRSVSEELPKPMVPVLGKPILEYQVGMLRRYGIRDIVIITGYKAKYIHDYFGDGSSFSVNISYINEDEPLGTAGALYYLRDQIDEDFLLLMGDLMMSVDVDRFMEAHKKGGGMATLFVHPNSHPHDSDVILTDTEGKLSDFGEDLWGQGKRPGLSEETRVVRGVLSKNGKRDDFCHNMVNAGIYAFKPEILDLITGPVKQDLDKDVIRPLIPLGEVMAYHSTEYVKDMGTPERYEAVSRDIASGLVEARNLSHRQKAIFLDRDGTLNEYRGFIRDPEELKLIDGAAEAVRLINTSEYLAIVITNQPVVARGEVSFSGLDRIHAKLETELGKEGAFLDDLFYCPHHPDYGFEGEVKELKFSCSCRKPGVGMLLLAAEKYNIDLSGSYMIGDSPSDGECGKNAGLHTILIDRDSGEGLLEAVRSILK